MEHVYLVALAAEVLERLRGEEEEESAATRQFSEKLGLAEDVGQDRETTHPVHHELP